MGDSGVLMGGGDRGGFLQIRCVPDATFATEIGALITAGTLVVGKLVTFTFANNYEVTSAAAAAIPDGKVISYRKTTAAAGDSYELTIRVFHYTDQNSADHAPVGIMTLPYDGTTALQDSVIVDGATYRSVEDGGTGGFGAVIGIDTTNTLVDVLF